MIPQGSQIVNLQYFESLTKRAQNIGSCDELQAFSSEAMASLQAHLAAINAQLAELQPILALLSPPSASPTAIVTWLTSFITSFLTPYVKPTITYASQLTEISAQIALVVAAINGKAASFPSCSISLPTLP